MLTFEGLYRSGEINLSLYPGMQAGVRTDARNKVFNGIGAGRGLYPLCRHFVVEDLVGVKKDDIEFTLAPFFKHWHVVSY
jgi:hypothetical protein